MSSNKAAEDKAAMHAGVTCLNEKYCCTQHDRIDLALQILSREHAATEMTAV